MKFIKKDKGLYVNEERTIQIVKDETGYNTHYLVKENKLTIERNNGISFRYYKTLGEADSLKEAKSLAESL